MHRKTVALAAAALLGTTLLTAAGLTVSGILEIGPSDARPSEAGPSESDPPQPVGPVTINVLSDVQGDLADFDTVLDAYSSFPPADHMVVNGDLVPGGQPGQYEAFLDVLNDHDHAGTTYTIGNKEFDGDSTSEENIDRFLRYTGMPRLYHTREVDGVPLIHLGSLENPEDWAVGNQSTLGKRQLDWLDTQLDRYGKHDPVLVFSHHPLPDSVSGTVGEGKQKYYDLDYAESERLLNILGEHPNVVFFSGHTHYSLDRTDWMNRVQTPDGHRHGFLAVSTGAVETEWGPNPEGPDQGEWVADGTTHKQALRVTVQGREVVVTSLDFESREVINRVSITMEADYRPTELSTPAWPGDATREP